MYINIFYKTQSHLDLHSPFPFPLFLKHIVYQANNSLSKTLDIFTLFFFSWIPLGNYQSCMNTYCCVSAPVSRVLDTLKKIVIILKKWNQLSKSCKLHTTGVSVYLTFHTCTSIIYTVHSLCYLFQTSCSLLKAFIFILFAVSKVASQGRTKSK